MKLAWVGKGQGGAGGDEVFDRKLLGALRQRGHHIDTHAPKAVGKVREVLGLLRGIPYYRARYLSDDNLRLVADASASNDVTIVSWEPFDHLAEAAQRPVILILHNITSQALPSMYPNNPVVKFLARRARAWEEKAYRSEKVLAIAVLSEGDRRLVREIAPGTRCCVVSPGMPPRVSIDASAPIRRELVLSGTYDWRPKRRDLEIFAREYDRLGLLMPIVCEDQVPENVATLLGTRLLRESADPRRGLRFGLVVDRFVAGHKLKVGSYIAQGCAVLSYADVQEDFAGIEDSDLFIRRIDHAGEIEPIIQSFEALSAQQVNRRFERFQQACAARFDWAASAAILADLIAGSEAAARPLALGDR